MCQGAGLAVVAMKMIRTLILSPLLPLLLAGKEYTIQLHRPAKVGDQFRVEMTGSESNTMARKVGDMEGTEEKNWSAKLKGIVTVLKVNKVGSVSQMKLKVDSFTITEGKFTEEALEKGAVIKGEEKDDKNQFELWDEESKLGVPLQDGIAADALKLLFSLDDAKGKETDDDVFGTKDKKKVGDSWKINAKALAESAGNDKVKIDPKKVGIKFDNPDNLKGRDADYNANKIIDVFSGVKNEFSEAICLNAAAALIVCNKFIRFEDAYEFSKKHLESDKALIHLKKIQTF